MKMPDYIEKALRRRERAAHTLMRNDFIVSEFITKNNIDCEYTYLHCETIVNPSLANTATIEAIIQKGRETE